MNIPANAPHAFRNASSAAARMLCLCAPAGQEEFFLSIGVPVASRTTAAPKASDEEATAMRAKAEALLPKYRTEMPPP